MLEECVARSVAAKIAVVQQDENDTAERLFLNFGHTVGHAVEAESLYKLAHGSAVAIGMAAEMKMSGFGDASRLLVLLKAIGMSVSFPEGSDPDVLWGIMKSDKKNIAGEVRIAVPETIGQGKVLSLPREQFKSLFA